MAAGGLTAVKAISTGVVEVDELLVAGLTWGRRRSVGVGTDIRMRVQEDPAAGRSGWTSNRTPPPTGAPAPALSPVTGRGRRAGGGHGVVRGPSRGA